MWIYIYIYYTSIVYVLVIEESKWLLSIYCDDVNVNSVHLLKTFRPQLITRKMYDKNMQHILVDQFVIMNDLI